ncbi:MAG: TonB-dependent receptor, partial [Gemmatimonadetes bacterium]|nr:TonB-dependent receptor [Gemmatimonadota bacterium]
NEGNGQASGVDFFCKYGAFLNTRLSGGMAYSLLRSRRLQVRHLGFEMLREEAPSPFDITHNLTLVTKMQIVRTLSGGLTLKYATGRPITPIVGAVPVVEKSYYLPVEGPVGSERLPSFQQIDGQLSYVHFFGSGHQAVFYLAVNNLLNRANVLDYDYSIDYTLRQPRTTLFRRSIYLGTSVSLNY